MRCLYTPKGIIRRHTPIEKKMHWQPCLCNSFRIIALAALKLLCLIFHVSKSQSRRGGGKSIARLNFKEIAESLLQVRPPKGAASLAGLCSTSRSSPSTQELRQLTRQGQGGEGLSQSSRARCRKAISAGQAARHTSHHRLHLPEAGKTLRCHRKKNKHAGSMSGAAQQTPSGSASG